MRRNGGTRKVHGSGKLYRKETKFKEKIWNELNEDIPGYDHHNDGDSLDGCITVSHKVYTFLLDSL
jgi:hypothetical protein